MRWIAIELPLNFKINTANLFTFHNCVWRKKR